MSVLPKSAQDLMLAPIALEIDSNLRRLRDKQPEELLYQLELELDRPANLVDRSDRERAIIDVATRWVNLHGYKAAVSSDGTRLQLSWGPRTLDLGLSAPVTDYLNPVG